MNIHKLNSFFIKSLIACTMSVVSVTAVFAFTVVNENSLGGENDFVYVVIGRIDNPGDSDDMDSRFGRKEACENGTWAPRDVLFASDLPYGVAFKATQQVADYYGGKSRLCMYVQFRSNFFKAVFDDNPKCVVKFHFKKKTMGFYGVPNDHSAGICNLTYK